MHTSENSASELFPCHLEEQELKRELLQKLAQLKQSNLEKDQHLQDLKERSVELHNLKEQYQNKTREHEETIMKSANNIMMLRENLKKMYLQFLDQSQDPVDVDNMSYEQLLELQEQVGHVSKGLTEVQMKKLHKEVYCAGVTEESSCMVCQDDFTEGAWLIVLPCKHTFHQECISEWLKKQKVCPLCKGECV